MWMAGEQHFWRNVLKTCLKQDETGQNPDMVSEYRPVLRKD